MMTKFLAAARNAGPGCPPDSHSLEGCATRLRRWLLALLLVLGVGAQAADVSVKASLSRGVTVIGEPVQFQVKITNAKRAGEPPDVKADGLDIRYLGPSTSTSMRVDGTGFHSESTTIQVYEVVAEKNGIFTIPAVELEVGGQKLRTEPVTLTVQKSSADDEARPQAQGLLEIVLPKKTAYVGEMIPVELRLYVDARIKWQVAAMPEVAGEGFTKQKMPDPRRPETVSKNGRDYDLLIFKTAITPGKAGKLSIGPGELTYNAQIPRARRSGPRSMFDLDDVFGDSFFAETRQIKVKAEPVELTVKPLPAAGKPHDFSGAVGGYQFSAEGRPNQVKVGDPVTMKLRVTGHGNFDRVEAPALKDANGWRSYPPSGTFQKDATDEVGMSGTKTFEMAVVPEEKKTQMPAFTFSYFDPEAEKYVTLASEPAPLKTDGAKPAAPAPAPVAPAAADAPNADSEAAPPKAAPNVTDIHGPRYDAGEPRTFAPLSERREFLLAQAGMLAALGVLVGFRLRRRPNADAARSAALRREKSALWAKLRRGEMAYAEFFDGAARIVQIDTALATGADAAGVDAPAARALAGADEATAEVIDEVFNARAELLFAGGGRDAGNMSGDERGRVLAALETFGRNNAKS